MTDAVIRVAAPSRLHFGMLAPVAPRAERETASGVERTRKVDTSADELREFGGVGVMIEGGPTLRIESAREFTAAGPLADRAAEFARRWASFYGEHRLPPVRIRIQATPPQHVGLGVGTQLALAVAAGLNALFERPQPLAAELAASVGRAERSAVGTYGFLMGGLIVERGKLPDERIAPLDCRLDLPEQWRFLLVRPERDSGLSGEREREAFARLPQVPPAVTDQLAAELHERMLPAAAQGRFDEFSESVYQFGRLAGTCFAAQQGGPYNGPLLAEIVGAVRSLGITGVGQSSWGPTVFALLPDASGYERLVSRLVERFRSEPLHVSLAAPDNGGARITRQ
jgi:beta-RFAP synthase